jgi:rod shape determining protein RodA
VIALYLGLIIRIIFIAERQRSAFSKIFGYSVACLLFAHAAINIGMTLGLLPVIGIPLPFLSYGGSNLWAFTVLLFIFIRQDASRFDLI